VDAGPLPGRVALMDSTIEYKGIKVNFLNLDPEDHIESYLNRGEWYEDQVLKFIEDLQVEGNYLDAGAYIGNHSIFFSLLCPSDLIYSFEPQRKAYDKMMLNLHANGIGNVVPHNCALSDRAGFGVFESAHIGNLGMATLSPDIKNYFTSAIIISLDSLNLDVKLMKIDVEGMELNVLRGAEKTLEGVEHLFVELPPLDTFEEHTRQQEIRAFLKKYVFVERRVFPEEQIHYFRKES
jgi:FkbM family methyltransferase